MFKLGQSIDIDPIIVSKLQLTKNEYTATVRNKFESNLLKLRQKQINDRNDTSKYRTRTSIHDLRQQLDDNQQTTGNLDGYITDRKVNSNCFVFLLFIWTIEIPFCTISLTSLISR